MNNTTEMVNHPAHYMSETGLETIDVIEAFTFDLKGIEAFDTANILKYICRWKNKNGLQDLKKARWYIDHLISHVSRLEEENKDDRGYDFDNIPFDSRKSAEEVLNGMNELIDTYGSVSVADMYDLVGLSCDYTDNKYGWTSLRSADVVRTRDGYIIKLPRATVIAEKLEEENKTEVE